MSSRGGRVPGSEGYNDADIRALLICVGEVRPTSKREWLRVLKLYRKRYAEPQMRSLRDVNSIKSKFRQILNIKSKAGNGKPHPSAMEAHKIQLDIQMRLHSLMAEGAHGNNAADDASDLSDSDTDAMSSGATTPAVLAAPPLFAAADAAQASSAETSVAASAAATVVRASPSRQPLLHAPALAPSLQPDSRSSPRRRASALSAVANAAGLLKSDGRIDETPEQLVLTRLAALEQQNIALNTRLHAMNDSAQQVLAARIETLEQQNSALTARLHTVSDAADALKTTNFDLREQILQLQTEFARIEAENRDLRASAVSSANN